MENIASTDSTNIESIYDLKGSTYDRSVLQKKSNKKRLSIGKGIVLKDNDFKHMEKYILVE